MKVLKTGDFVIALLSAALVSLSFLSYGNLSGNPTVHIKAGANEWIYDIAQDRTVSIPGPIGSTVIEIVDSRVHVSHSDCSNKVCVAAGWKDSVGEWIICLPNNVFVLIEGDRKPMPGGIDDTAF